jgi:alpha-beta hydrolase superfamily lysophospholipase
MNWGNGTSDFFTRSDGLSVHYRTWGRTAPELAEKVILCLHGFHSHGEKWAILADQFIDRNWVTVAPDMRGHGLSWNAPSERGDIDNYQLWIQGCTEFLEFLAQQYPAAALHIVAESMGAGVALHTAISHPRHLESLILLSPAIRTTKSVGFATILETLTFGLISSPSKQSIPDRSKGHFGTNRREYMEYQATDPLRMPKSTPRYNFQVLKMIHELRKLRFGSFYPTLIFYGGGDHLIDIKGPKQLILRINSKHKALHYIPAAAHELLTDRNAEKYGMLEKIEAWISSAPYCYPPA